MRIEGRETAFMSSAVRCFDDNRVTRPREDNGRLAVIFCLFGVGKENLRNFVFFPEVNLFLCD